MTDDWNRGGWNWESDIHLGTLDRYTTPFSLYIILEFTDRTEVGHGAWSRGLAGGFVRKWKLTGCMLLYVHISTRVGDLTCKLS